MIVVLLCGIPGSGKSTLCSNLLQEWDKRNQLLNDTSKSYHISFDDIQDKYFMDKLNENSFQDIRKKGLDELKYDIMYLHSMRREVFVITRDFNSKLLVVWVKLDYTLALERNNNRIKEKIVNEKALLNIYNNFESPTSNNICDRNYCIIDSSIKQSLDDGIKIIINSILDLQFLLSQEIFQVNKKINNKISSNINTATIVHHIDIHIRKLVGLLHKKIAEYDENKNKKNSNNDCKNVLINFNNESKKEIIKIINETKAIILECIRDGMDIIMVKSINDDNEKLNYKKCDDTIIKINQINIESTIENYNNIYLKSILYKLLENKNCDDDYTNSSSNIEYISVNDYLINFIKEKLYI